MRSLKILNYAFFLLVIIIFISGTEKGYCQARTSAVEDSVIASVLGDKKEAPYSDLTRQEILSNDFFVHVYLSVKIACKIYRILEFKSNADDTKGFLLLNDNNEKFEILSCRTHLESDIVELSLFLGKIPEDINKLRGNVGIKEKSECYSGLLDMYQGNNSIGVHVVLKDPSKNRRITLRP